MTELPALAATMARRLREEVPEDASATDIETFLLENFPQATIGDLDRAIDIWTEIDAQEDAEREHDERIIAPFRTILDRAVKSLEELEPPQGDDETFEHALARAPIDHRAHRILARRTRCTQCRWLGGFREISWAVGSDSPIVPTCPKCGEVALVLVVADDGALQ